MLGRCMRMNPPLMFFSVLKSIEPFLFMKVTNEIVILKDFGMPYVVLLNLEFSLSCLSYGNSHASVLQEGQRFEKSLSQWASSHSRKVMSLLPEALTGRGTAFLSNMGLVICLRLRVTRAVNSRVLVN